MNCGDLYLVCFSVILDSHHFDTTRDVAKIVNFSNFVHEIMRKGYYSTFSGWQDKRISEAMIRII